MVGRHYGSLLGSLIPLRIFCLDLVDLGIVMELFVYLLFKLKHYNPFLAHFLDLFKFFPL